LKIENKEPPEPENQEPRTRGIAKRRALLAGRTFCDGSDDRQRMLWTLTTDNGQLTTGN
jgi:hypothetical protein